MGLLMDCLAVIALSFGHDSTKIVILSRQQLDENAGLLDDSNNDNEV